MSTEKIAQQLIRKIEKETTSFSEAIPDVERRIYQRLLALLKDIETTGDRITNSVANLKIINSLDEELQKAVLQSDYEGKVKEFVTAFSVVGQLQREYFSALTSKFKPKAVLIEIEKQAIKWTVDSLTESGISAGVKPGIELMLRENITSGGSYASLTEQLRNSILTNPNGEGIMARYVNTIAVDAINQFSRQISTTISADLGLNWNRYIGSLLTTSRPWCVHMVKKEFIHNSELKTVLFDRIDQVKICSTEIPCNKKTGLPSGLKEGTDEFNIKVRAGGWKCGHGFYAVSDDQVPEILRMKFK